MSRSEKPHYRTKSMYAIERHWDWRHLPFVEDLVCYGTGLVVIRLKGFLGLSAALGFKMLLADLGQKGENQVVLNMDKVLSISTDFNAVICQKALDAKVKGGKIVITSIDIHMEEVFSEIEALLMIRSFETERDAIDHLLAAHPQSKPETA